MIAVDGKPWTIRMQRERLGRYGDAVWGEDNLLLAC
jgi:hypothetical protein